MKQALKIYTKENGKLVMFQADVPDVKLDLEKFINDSIKIVRHELPHVKAVMCVVPKSIEQLKLF